MLNKLKKIVLNVLMLGACIGWVPAMSSEIVVAQIGPFTGLPSPDQTEIHQAAQAYFDQVNRSGGIAGAKINYIKFDDQFKPDLFKQYLSEAINKKAVALICAEHPAAMIGLLKEKFLDNSDIVIINNIPGIEVLRNPGHTKLFHIRASDVEQFKRMLDHGRTVGTTSIHVLYQDVLAGKNGFNAISKAGPAMGYTKIGGVETKPDEASLTAAAKTVMVAEPQAVVVVGQPKFMVDAIKSLRNAGFTRSVLATSYVSAPLLVKTLGADKARGIGIVQTFPNPSGNTLPLHQDFQKTMTSFAPNVKTYTSFHIEGYLSARVLVDALRRTKGKTSSEALMTALRAGEMNYDGFRVDFTKGNSGSTWTDMSVIDASGKLRY